MSAEGKLGRLDTIDEEDVARFENADSRGQSRFAGNAVEHGFRAGTEAEFPERAVSERNGFQTDLVAAGVSVLREIALVAEPRENPGARASGYSSRRLISALRRPPGVFSTISRSSRARSSELVGRVANTTSVQ